MSATVAALPPALAFVPATPALALALPVGGAGAGVPAAPMLRRLRPSDLHTPGDFASFADAIRRDYIDMLNKTTGAMHRKRRQAQAKEQQERIIQQYAVKAAIGATNQIGHDDLNVPVISPSVDAVLIEHIPVSLRDRWNACDIDTRVAIGTAILSCATSCALVLFNALSQKPPPKPQEIIQQLVQVAGAAAFLGGVGAWIVRKLGSQALGPIVAAASSLGLELSFDTCKQAVLNVFGGTIMVCAEMYEHYQQHGTKGLIEAFADSVFTTVTTTAVVAPAVAAAMPCLVTVLMMFIFGCVVQRVKREALASGFSIVGSIIKGVVGIPRSIYRVFVPVTYAPNWEDLMPGWSLCNISQEVMSDPVFVNGCVVERHVAVRWITDRHRDFYGANATEHDIREMKELKLALEQYKRLYLPQ